MQGQINGKNGADFGPFRTILFNKTFYDEFPLKFVTIWGRIKDTFSHSAVFCYSDCI